MDSPKLIHHRNGPSTLSPCRSGRRRSGSAANSPEFEFWRVRNPSLSPPNLLSADELFHDGVLLPLDLLPNKSSEAPDPDPQKGDPESPSSDPPVPDPEPEPGPGPELISESVTSLLTASKRWKDIFKKGEKKAPARSHEEKEKEKKREKKSQTGASSAELNINIWPFSRSRSAGTSGARPRMAFGAPATRKVSSAPCSRSNSAGESKSRKWPSSPGRAGVHLGRSSPVWQVRRAGTGAKNSEPTARSSEKPGSNREHEQPFQTRKSKPGSGNSNTSSGDGKTKGVAVALNVPTCIGYSRSRLSCRSDESSSPIPASGNGNASNISSGNSNVGSGSSNHFSFRSLFAKKVY